MNDKYNLQNCVYARIPNTSKVRQVETKTVGRAIPGREQVKVAIATQRHLSHTETVQ